MNAPESFTDIEDLLGKIPYFSRVDKKVLGDISKSAIRRTFEAEQVVLLEGEPSVGLFVVQSGWVKSVKGSPQGREQVMRVVGPGEVFNAIGALASDKNPGTVIALEAATVWILPRDDLLQLLESQPSLSSMVVQTLAARVQDLMDQVENLSLRNVEARLAHFLIEEADNGVVERKRWETQAELAARLGTVPNVLNRVLRRFTEDELIQMDRQEIRILDHEQIALIAQLP